MADQVPEERQYALILVAGGDKAFNCWDTLEDTVEDPKQVDQGSRKQVQAENANALHKNSSDSEMDRLQDIHKEPCRHIGPSCVKELAKFFIPTSDEEDHSHVNTRTRCKKLFEPKEKERGSEK